MDMTASIEKIFNENLVTAFVGGSEARGESKEESDIDFFVCTHNDESLQNKHFLEYYNSIHQQNNRKPDSIYPGELMTLDTLVNALNYTLKSEPKFTIIDTKVWDGLVWAGMLCDEKKYQKKSLPDDVLSLANKIVTKWNRELFGDFDSTKTIDLKNKVYYKSESAIRKSVTALAKTISIQEESIIDILLKYESYETALDEIHKSLDTLLNIDKEIEHIISSHVNYVSSFLPLNLPLYSLVLFGFIPSLMSEKTFVKPPYIALQVFEEIYSKLFSNYPKLIMNKSARNNFVENYVEHSDVVMFCGRETNAQVIERICHDKLFIYNGAGINPIIVAPNADIANAVKKTITARIFNSGQDCAGPDVILVDQKISEEFIYTLKKELDKVVVGEYADRKVRVGRLGKKSQVSNAENVFASHQEHIIYGGKIDYETNTVFPTIISIPISQYKNYTEFFAPILMISTYRDEKELMSYFSTETYKDFAMYTTIFGHINSIKEIPNSNILYDNILQDLERGNNAYGGYGNKANFVSIHGQRYIRPILISKEISSWRKDHE